MVYRKKSLGSYKKKSGYRKGPSNYKKKVPKVSFEKRVKNVISHIAETKTAEYRGSLNMLSANNVNYITGIIPCTPFTSYLSIPQGTGASERIGNQIRIKKLSLKGVIIPSAYNATTNPNPRPQFVKLFFLTRKDSPMEIYSTLTDVFQYGTTSEGFGTALYNLMRPINTDEWMCHLTKTFKVGYASSTGTGGVAGSEYYANNEFKITNFVNVDLTKYCPKIFKFDDNTVNPSSRNIILYPVVYTADGSVYGGGEVPATFQYNLQVEYYDM